MKETQRQLEDAKRETHQLANFSALTQEEKHHMEGTIYRLRNSLAHVQEEKRAADGHVKQLEETLDAHKAQVRIHYSKLAIITIRMYKPNKKTPYLKRFTVNILKL